MHRLQSLYNADATMLAANNQSEMSITDA